MLLAATWRETAKARTAQRLGLEIADAQKRTSFSVLENIDPVGTIALPAALVLLWLVDTSAPPLVFAFAKPFSVETTAHASPRIAALKVHGAGIVANAVMTAGAAVLLYLAYWLPGGFATFFIQMCRLLLLMNIMMVLFHLIPVPPFDLGRILFASIASLRNPHHLQMALRGAGGLFVLAALAALWSTVGMNPIADILWPPAEFLYNQIVHILHAL